MTTDSIRDNKRSSPPQRFNVSERITGGQEVMSVLGVPRTTLNLWVNILSFVLLRAKETFRVSVQSSFSI